MNQLILIAAIVGSVCLVVFGLFSALQWLTAEEYESEMDAQGLGYPMPDDQTIKVVCMDCGVHVRGPKDGIKVSHGLCRKHYNQRMNEIQQMKEIER